MKKLEFNEYCIKLEKEHKEELRKVASGRMEYLLSLKAATKDGDNSNDNESNLTLNEW